MKKITLLLFALFTCWQINAQSIVIGTGTSTTTSTGSDPIDGYYESFRYQVVYTAAELSASLTPYDEITALGFSIAGDYAGGNLLGYTIKMGHTTATNSATHDSSPTIVVKNPFNYNPTVTADGVFDMITFDNNFVWNGVDNVLIEICSDGPNAFVSPYGQVRVTSMTNGSRYYRVDGGVSCNVNTNTINGDRPNIQFNYIEGTPPSCLAPNALGATNILATSAQLSWNENGSASLWNIEYGVTGFTQGSGTVITGVTNPQIVSGLMPNTVYQFYVQADCGGGAFSAWAGPFTFTTLCSTYVAPFLESFETPALPACWTQGGDNTWEYGSSATTPTGFAAYGAANVPDHSVSGTGTFIGMDGSDNTDGEVSTLTTPLIDVSGLTIPYLSYYVFSNNVDDAAQNELVVEFFDGAAWNTVETIQANLGTDWVMYGADLTTFTITGGVQVRFTVTGVANGGSAFYNDILIDDVSIDEAPACFAPTGLAVSNVTTNTVDITWNDGSGGTQFDFYYVIQPAGTGTAGITVENYYDYSSGVPFTATCTDLTDCANTLLTPNTAYEVFVRDDCGGAWVGPVNFSTPCNPYTIPYFEGFESGYTHNVTVDGCITQQTITGTQVWTANNTFTDYNRTPRTGSWNAFLRYGNEDWLFIPIDLVGGTSYRVQLYARQDGATAANSNIAISYGTTNTGAAMTNTIVAATGIINGTYQQIYGDFTPASSGTYYVGIKGYMNFSPWYISLDDISIDLSPSCLDPNMFTASNISTSSVDLSWNDTSGGTQTDYEYVIQAQGIGMPAGSGVAISATSATGITTDINTNPLLPNTAYEAWVRSDCGGGSYSAWVGPIYFSTNIEVICGTPVNTVYCYDDNDTTTWTFTSNDGSPLRITFNAGAIESCCDDILIYDGTDNSGTLLYQGNNGGDLSGLIFDSTSDSIYIEIDSDSSVSCVDTGLSPQWDFTVACATCVNPTATFTIVPDCVNAQFSVEVDLTDLGTATSVTISDGTTDLTGISATGVETFGPYADGASVTIDVTNEQDNSCTISSGALTNVCPPANDDCANAEVLTPGAVFTDNPVVGTNVGATDSGETAPGCAFYQGGDVWYTAQVPASGSLTFEMNSVTGGITDGAGAVYSGSCGSLVLIDCDDFSSSDPNDMPLIQVTGRTPGEVLYFMVWEYGNNDFGEFQVSAYDASLSANSFDSNSFVAYPNPVKDVLTLEYTSDISSVRVLNMLGQEVLTRTVNAASAQVDMSQLAAGTYLVNVTSGDVQKTIKVVKQ